MRVDKYLWAVRLFKTRSLSTKECKQNRVIVNDEFVKPSRELKKKDEITIKKGPIFYSYIVLDFPKSRVGAKLVEEFVKDVTSEEELHKLALINESYKLSRSKGEGRPTKRERRAINKFFENDSERD